MPSIHFTHRPLTDIEKLFFSYEDFVDLVLGGRSVTILESTRVLVSYRVSEQDCMSFDEMVQAELDPAAMSTQAKPPSAVDAA